MERGNGFRRYLEFDTVDLGIGGVGDVGDARGDERLHLQVRVIVMEHRAVNAQLPIEQVGLDAEFIAPQEFRVEALRRIGAGNVEPARFETTCHGGVDQDVVDRLQVDLELRRPAMVVAGLVEDDRVARSGRADSQRIGVGHRPDVIILSEFLFFIGIAHARGHRQDRRYFIRPLSIAGERARMDRNVRVDL